MSQSGGTASVTAAPKHLAACLLLTACLFSLGTASVGGTAAVDSPVRATSDTAPQQIGVLSDAGTDAGTGTGTGTDAGTGTSPEDGLIWD
ncbi:hypothetical protein [Streptomyces sp. NPDC004284]|uniref:hypothetical protein n=1 Tax=Streptomyces sp. NPDC004284 TaxID=3364695 RepID=UPI0036C2C15F